MVDPEDGDWTKTENYTLTNRALSEMSPEPPAIVYHDLR